MSRRIYELVHDVERNQLDADAKVLFEEDAPGWLTWQSAGETLRAEYRRLPQAERRGPS
jgi:hypothetical protein